MHEAAFPATLLLGMEGFFGLLFGVPLYLCFARRFGESPAATRAAIASSPSKATTTTHTRTNATDREIVNLVESTGGIAPPGAPRPHSP